jgi:hypothetical protein
MIIYELTRQLAADTKIAIQVTHLATSADDLLELVFDEETGYFNDAIQAIKDDMQTVGCENNSFWSSPIRQYNLDYIMQSEAMQKWSPKIVLGKTMDRPKVTPHPTRIY